MSKVFEPGTKVHVYVSSAVPHVTGEVVGMENGVVSLKFISDISGKQVGSFAAFPEQVFETREEWELYCKKEEARLNAPFEESVSVLEEVKGILKASSDPNIIERASELLAGIDTAIEQINEYKQINLNL